MTITSVGSFKLEGQTATVHDSAVTDDAVILVQLQDAKGLAGGGGWDGPYGVVRRTPTHSFEFSSARPGCGMKFGYVILER